MSFTRKQNSGNGFPTFVWTHCLNAAVECIISKNRLQYILSNFIIQSVNWTVHCSNASCRGLMTEIKLCMELRSPHRPKYINFHTGGLQPPDPLIYTPQTLKTLKIIFNVIATAAYSIFIRKTSFEQRHSNSWFELIVCSPGNVPFLQLRCIGTT